LGRSEMHTEVLVGIPEGKKLLEDTDVHGRIIIK
jgi:hypothetical protein